MSVQINNNIYIIIIQYKCENEKRERKKDRGTLRRQIEKMSSRRHRRRRRRHGRRRPKKGKKRVGHNRGA